MGHPVICRDHRRILVFLSELTTAFAAETTTTPTEAASITYFGCDLIEINLVRSSV